MARAERPLAIVTGASAGIGLELAKLAAKEGYDLIIAADDGEELRKAGEFLRGLNGAAVDTVEADLATIEGVDRLIAKAEGRTVEVLCANAGHGLGHAFLDQDWGRARHVVDTNVTGTLYLIHAIGRRMRDRRNGRILITGSIAGFLPGTYQAVYNGTKAFMNSFGWALRTELEDTGVSVTVLMPGATETEFFERADMLDTAVGAAPKDDPSKVASDGWEAMKRGDGDIVSGLHNKAQTAVASVTPSAVLAHQHAKQAAPGSAKR
jgi:short-subunit dehydrogenase